MVRISQWVGLILKQARVARGMSLTKVSQMSGVSRRAIRVMERGDGAVPGLGTILKVSRVVGVSLVDVAKAVERPWPVPNGSTGDGDAPGPNG